MNVNASFESSGAEIIRANSPSIDYAAVSRTLLTPKFRRCGIRSDFDRLETDRSGNIEGKLNSSEKTSISVIHLAHVYRYFNSK